MPNVREAKPEDARALGCVHVRAWQRAYRNGLMPDAYLRSLSSADRAQMWLQILQQAPGPRSSRLVVEGDEGAVVGFIVVGPVQEDLETGAGEIFALNVDPDVWGLGLGQALLAAGTKALHLAGFVEAVLWVHPANGRARRFYEGAGWEADGAERRQEVLGVRVPEVRYRKSLAQ